MFDFKNPYNREDFLIFLQQFLPENFKKEITRIEASGKYNYLSKITKLGSVEDLDLEIFEIEHSSQNDARVSIASEAFKFISHTNYNKALIAFIPKNSNTYRFSLLEITPFEKDSGKIGREFSNPKRYSFLCGKDAHTRTCEQFLIQKGRVKDSQDLHGRFSIEVVTKQFYSELFNWYETAYKEAKYPNGKTEEHIIRLITRLMFVWFIKQKNLIPDEIFQTDKLTSILADFKPESKKDGNYYNAILQNLFFATLNNEINERCFASASTGKRNEDFGIKEKFRDDNKGTFFKISQSEVIKLLKPVPFLNGGLFECLDKYDDKEKKTVYYDGFSREPKLRAFIPNNLFFDSEKGIISILNKYNFTIEENMPHDADIALDPELLGRAFENLLGAYNPETKETVRKSTGSFYTPREIVDYMVKESLNSYLENTLTVKYSQSAEVIKALKSVKIFDPACGSGAFPMGILNEIVHRVKGINPKENIYKLKLNLIENCIYGTDIQPIAIQISKLRFFISLICEQRPNKNPDDNYGIAPLPNLETKFVAANSLLGIVKQEAQGDLFGGEIDEIKKELVEVRKQYINVRTLTEKTALRKQDRRLSKKLAKALEDSSCFFNSNDAKQLADWDPYNQNASAPFFDPDWMFNLSEGFDIVIGNPPYIQLQNNQGELAKFYQHLKFKTFERTGDIYALFYEKGMDLLKNKGILCFITSNKWMRAGYGQSLRKFLSQYNPKILIDLGSGVFESATVDTNILIEEKSENQGKTKCVIVKNSSNKMSDLIRQSAQSMRFTADAWVILNSIGQSIKAKIEKLGTPLKDWNITINYGIKTGCNEAFIINEDKKNELVSKDSKSAEIIRPILRGRDIKRYGYEFANLYLIATFPSCHYNIADFPAIKDYFENFGKDDEAHLKEYGKNCWGKKRLGQTGEQGARKKTNNKWFETQDSISYWDDFFKQKVVWSDIATEPSFVFIKEPLFFNNTCYMMTNVDLWIVGILNSKIIKWYFPKIATDLGGGTRYFKQFVETLSLPTLESNYKALRTNIEQFIKNGAYNNIDKLLYKFYEFSQEEIEFIDSTT